MKLKQVQELEGNEITAEDVRSGTDIILIPRGSRVKKEYAGLLLGLDITAIFVENQETGYGRTNPDSGQESMFFPKQVIHYYTEYVRYLFKSLSAHKPDTLRDAEAISENMIGYCREHINQKITLEERTIGDLSEHTVYVTLMSTQIALEMNLSIPKLYQIAMACLLHDVGLMHITAPYQDMIYEELSDEEVFDFKKHTIYGFSLVERENWLTDSARCMILSHHEKIDGSGFPFMKKKQSVECRIIQTVDSFDCMISGVEKKHMPMKNVIEELEAYGGIHYDKNILEMLIYRFAK